ncbi:MAG: hypothetical protein IT379_08610 [Deltaproteobacteria bacterium]|nr:hypothetical protein [Deltaproteobacteria bacterium]
MSEAEPEGTVPSEGVGAAPEPSPVRGPIPRWLAALGAVAVYGLATVLPLPGVDQEALAATTGATGGGLLALFDVAVRLSPFGDMLIWLVLTRGIARVIAKEPSTHNPWADRGMFALFAIIAVVRGLGIAMYLESVAVMGTEVVAEPGWRFRLLVGLTFAGAAAVTWALASFVSRTRVAQGPLLLLGASLIVQHVAGGMEVGRAIASGDQTPLRALVHVASLLPALVVMVALWRKTPTEWPLRIARGAVLTGPADALVFPYLSGLALTSVIVAGPGLMLPGAWIVPYVGLALSVGLAIGFLVWTNRLSSDRRRVGYLVSAFVAPLSSLVLVSGGIAIAVMTGAPLGGAFAPPGPFEGNEHVRAEAVSSVGAAAADAPVVRARLRELGIDAEVRAVGRDRLVIEMSGVRQAERALVIALRPNRLSFRLVAADQGALAPGDGEVAPPGVEIHLRSFGRESVRVFEADSREALATILARPGVDRSEVAVECETFDGRTRCAAWRLEPDSLTSRDVAEARVAFDEMDGSPYVDLVLTDDGAERFESVTASAIGRRLAICNDGEIVSDPVIQTRISGGRARITMGTQGTFEEARRQAWGLVAALRGGSIEGDWRIEPRGRSH